MKSFLSILIVLASISAIAQPTKKFDIDTEKQNVLCMDISPDGNVLVAGGDKNEIHVYNPENGQKLFDLEGHSDWVTALGFSDFDDDHKKYVFTGARDGKLIVYDFEKRQIAFQFAAHEKTINSIIYLSSINYIITVSSDGHMGVTDLNTRQMVNKVKVSDDPVLGLAKLSEQNTVITSDAQGKIRYWDPLTGNMDKIIEAHQAYSRDVVVIKNDLISCDDDKTIKIWDTETTNLKNTFAKAHKKWIQILRNGKDEKHFLSGGHDGKVLLWEIGRSTPIFQVEQGGSFVTGIALSSDLQTMYTSGFGGKINVWDISYFKLKPVEKVQATSLVSTGGKKGQGGERSDRNEIVLIQPLLRKQGDFWTMDETLRLSGQALATKSIREFRISNLSTKESDRIRLGDNYVFEHEIPLRYRDNKIQIQFVSVSGDTIKKEFVVNRIFDEKNPDELINLSRNGRDYALVIVTNEYSEMGDLTNPVFDGTTIAAELENNYGFEVEKVINPKLDEIKLKIKEYSKRMYADEDQLFIFIAGHGEYDEFFKEGYLVASNSLASDEARSTYIPHSTMRTYINNIPCKHIFLTMDVCFGGTFDPFLAKRGAGDARDEQIQKMLFIKRKLKYKTRIYITSGGKEYVPDGRPGAHSPFARKFIEALRTYGGSDGVLTYKDIMSNVEMVSPEPRTGEFGDNEPGSDFLFISR